MFNCSNLLFVKWFFFSCINGNFVRKDLVDPHLAWLSIEYGWTWMKDLIIVCAWNRVSSCLKVTFVRHLKTSSVFFFCNIKWKSCSCFLKTTWKIFVWKKKCQEETIEQEDYCEQCSLNCHLSHNINSNFCFRDFYWL